MLQAPARRLCATGSSFPSSRAGQSLFTIDPAPFEAAVARAQAEVASAEATHAQAARNARRYKPLYEARAASQKDYDDALTTEGAADVLEARADAVIARDSMPPERLRALNPLCSRMRVA